MKTTTEFETLVRGVPVFVEATAWSDHEGVYKIALDVFCDGALVTGLMTDDDMNQLESESLEQMQNDYSEKTDRENFERNHSARVLG